MLCGQPKVKVFRNDDVVEHIHSLISSSGPHIKVMSYDRDLKKSNQKVLLTMKQQGLLASLSSI